MGVEVGFGLGGRFWDRVGGLRDTRECGCKLLAVRGGRRHVIHAALALESRLEYPTAAGHMVGQGRQHLQCCSPLQVQLLQQGRDEARRPQVVKIQMRVLVLCLEGVAGGNR